MLVLSRKEGQSILIGGDIWVQVVQIRGGQVRLAFRAPGNVPIVREELLEEALERARGCPGIGPRPLGRRTA